MTQKRSKKRFYKDFSGPEERPTEVLQQAGWEANIDYAAPIASGPGMGTGLGVEWGWEGLWGLGVGCITSSAAVMQRGRLGPKRGWGGWGPWIPAARPQGWISLRFGGTKPKLFELQKRFGKSVAKSVAEVSQKASGKRRENVGKASITASCRGFVRARAPPSLHASMNASPLLVPSLADMLTASFFASVTASVASSLSHSIMASFSRYPALR